MSTTSHYNPDWLSDDALLANFVARQHDFSFLRDELSRAPLEGNVQHYLLVGVRGAGKTTLLKRLAVAIRRDTDLNEHLIALSFPEEMYQVKNLADFWWAACDALADELDFLKREGEADGLMAAIATARRNDDRSNPVSDVAFQLLQQTCARLKLRPVMLVDNLDMVFQRIDKNGRKLNDPHAPAYWALREALSTSTSPIVIGASVRLSAPFKDYDKAFYDFFLPKRLGTLSLDAARQMFERLAIARNLADVRTLLHDRPGRVQALHELTGGNIRALALAFELLQHYPASGAADDFQRLMDGFTPFYKARFEALSEQAQVILHALAMLGGGVHALAFGHVAAAIGLRCGLPTSTVSAQLAILEDAAMVEKSSSHGRTQYRMSEQLFRLWLRMRGTRRSRQQVHGLARFFEAMYDDAPVSATSQGLHDHAGRPPQAAVPHPHHAVRQPRDSANDGQLPDPALTAALARLPPGGEHTARIVLGHDFVEGFLASVLLQPGVASGVLLEMRRLDYDMHARPLMLAFLAALQGRADMLSELEPEVQGTTRRLYARLTMA